MHASKAHVRRWGLAIAGLTAVAPIAAALEGVADARIPPALVGLGEVTMAYSLPGPDCGARTAVAIAAHQPGNRLYVALAAADPTPDDRTCVEPQSLAMTLHARSDGSYEAVSGASPCEHERFFVSARVESGGTSIVRYENANGCEYDFTIDGAVRWV